MLFGCDGGAYGQNGEGCRDCGRWETSEQGWQEFLAADGVDDWVVLHGGATTVFRTGSLAETVALAAAVAQVPGIAGSGRLLTIADTRLTVRLTGDPWQLEPDHPGFGLTLRRSVYMAVRGGVGGATSLPCGTSTSSWSHFDGRRLE